MGDTSFSIDTALATTKLVELGKQREGLDERINTICEKAFIGQYPVARIVLSQFDPTPSDLLMLSKVFQRLSVLLAEHKDLQEKEAALKAITGNSEWLYTSIGSPERDVELFLTSFNESGTV